MKATLGLAAIAALVAGVLTGCAPTVALTPAGDATSAKCAGVIVRLPSTVSTLNQRQTDAQGTSAWGEPADILLRCGVPVPDPTATLPCITIDGIDWLQKADRDEVYVFTTYGRNPAIAVTINTKDVDADPGRALSDLAKAVASIPSRHHCIAPSQG
jgi:hypothetical protein